MKLINQTTPHPSSITNYPRFGKGPQSGNTYIQFSVNGDWHSMVEEDVRTNTCFVVRLPLGTKLTFEQE